MGTLADLASSVTGNINKAMLCVKKPANIGQNLPNSSLSTIDLRAKLVPRTGFQAASIRSFTEVKNMAASSGYHVMQVKYNPSSIHFSTQAGSFLMSGPGNVGVAQITQVTVPAQTSMRVDLVFDALNVKDAFMKEKYDLSAGGMVTSAAGVVNQVKKDGYSVQNEVEGLVALITQSESRQVVFYWSEMAFAGEVTNVNAVYTMFNPQGNPIRATVTLSIRQDESDLGKGDKVYWDKAFNKLFGDYTEESDYDAGSWMDKVGNLIQF